MSLTVEISHHPQRPRFLIKLRGLRERFYAKDCSEVALAVDHYFGGTDPRHWGTGVPGCPLCTGDPK